MLNFRINGIAALFLTLLACAGLAAAETTVYDNSINIVQADSTWIPKGFLEFSRFSSSELQGDEVILEGTDRKITEFDVVLMSQGPVVLDTLSIGFYHNDAHDDYLDGLPGTLIWSTTLTDLRLEGGLQILSISVPQVEVPDRFTWLVGAESMMAGLVPCGPVTKGQSPVNSLGDYYWDYAPAPFDCWYPGCFGDGIPADLGAKFVAVPEPASFAILFAGSIIALRRRKLRA